MRRVVTSLAVPALLPALNAMLYGVSAVHWAVTLPLASALAVEVESTEPKSTSVADAAVIVQALVTAILTLNVVVSAALAKPMVESRPSDSRTGRTVRMDISLTVLVIDDATSRRLPCNASAVPNITPNSRAI